MNFELIKRENKFINGSNWNGIKTKKAALRQPFLKYIG